MYNIWEKLKQIEAKPELYSLFCFIMRVLYGVHTLYSHTINQHFSLQLLGFLMDTEPASGIFCTTNIFFRQLWHFSLTLYKIGVMLDCWKPTICIADVSPILHWLLFSSYINDVFRWPDSTSVYFHFMWQLNIAKAWQIWWHDEGFF